MTAVAAHEPGSPPATCGVCGGGLTRRWAAREMMLGRRDPFTYGECGRCGALKLLDPPSDFAPYYGGGYYSFENDLDAEFADQTLRESAASDVRALLSPHVPEAEAPMMPGVRRALLSMRRLRLEPHARVLDVGCGAGRLPYLLHLAGFGGVEGADPFLSEERRYACGLRVRRAGVEAVEGGWDVLMMHHVFEHLADPAEALRQVERRLAPGGRVLLRLPLVDSIAWRRYRADWVQLDAPRHLHLHTRRSLARAAAAAGLVIQDVVCDSYEFQFWGSEQYRLDIPLNDPGGWRHGAGAPLFTPAQIARWRRWSARLNRLGLGDQAAVYLRRS